MERKKVKIMNLMSGILFGLLMTSVTISMVGCGDKKKSNNGSNYGYGNRFRYGGGGYNGYGQISNVSAGIETSGRAIIILASSSEGSFGTGPTYVEGELEVMTPIACPMGYAGIEPDLYYLEPYGATSIGDGYMLSNVSLVGRGRYSDIQVQIPYAYTFRSNVCGMDGMVGMMNIVSVDGYPCNLSLGFSDNSALAGGICR